MQLIVIRIHLISSRLGFGRHFCLHPHQRPRRIGFIMKYVSPTTIYWSNIIHHQNARFILIAQSILNELFRSYLFFYNATNKDQLSDFEFQTQGKNKKAGRYGNKFQYLCWFCCPPGLHTNQVGYDSKGCSFRCIISCWNCRVFYPLSSSWSLVLRIFVLECTSEYERHSENELCVAFNLFFSFLIDVYAPVSHAR